MMGFIQFTLAILILSYGGKCTDYPWRQAANHARAVCNVMQRLICSPLLKPYNAMNQVAKRASMTADLGAFLCLGMLTRAQTVAGGGGSGSGVVTSVHAGHGSRPLESGSLQV